MKSDSSTKKLVSVKEQDYLTEDPPIRGQKYACISFVSPEDVLKQKDMFLFEHFLKTFASDMKKFVSDLKLFFHENEKIYDMIECVENRYDYVFDSEKLSHEYENFKSKESESLEMLFNEQNDNKTSIRGFKIRGVFENILEAKKKAQQLQQSDPNFNVYVAQVGYWCPWSPNPDDIDDTEYAVTQLNTLMKNYKESLDERDRVYNTRMKEYIINTQKRTQNKQNIFKLEMVEEEDSNPSQPPSSPIEITTITSKNVEEDIHVKHQNDDEYFDSNDVWQEAKTRNNNNN